MSALFSLLSIPNNRPINNRKVNQDLIFKVKLILYAKDLAFYENNINSVARYLVDNKFIHNLKRISSCEARNYMMHFHYSKHILIKLNIIALF